MTSQRPPRRFRRLHRRRIAGREVAVAKGWLSRVLGLAFLSARRAGDGLLIPRCRAVHTFGMRFPIHVVFLDGGGRPISVHGAVPRRRFVCDRRAAAVLELPFGKAAR